LLNLKDSVKFILFPCFNDYSYRKCVQTSLGCHIYGICLPHVDPDDRDSSLSGVSKRFARETPTPNRDTLRDLRKFVKRWLKKNLTRLDPTTDVSVERWLANTRYPDWRKKDLLAKWNDYCLMKPNFNIFDVQSFIKDETYTEWKFSRGINSRTDEFKCLVGPIFQIISDKVFELPWFIKKIPVADRPDYIYDRLYSVGAKYFASDYTAYESHFTKILMENVEFQLYSYMTKDMPCHDDFMSLCSSVLAGTNKCRYKGFTAKLEATRMSGEMCTSLGNGFANLMLMLFLCDKKGCREVRGVVEGDDGLFAAIGNFPNSADFADVGFTIKIELHDNLATASFCGIIFDVEDRANVTNPLEALASFGWTTFRYHNAPDSTLMNLLRCKSLSYAYQYPGCPILQEMALYGLRMTHSRDVRHFVKESKSFDMWEREQLLDSLSMLSIPIKEIGFNTRLLVEEKFGVPVDRQMLIESYFRNCSVIQPIPYEFVEDLVPVIWKDYYINYVEEADPKSKRLCCPTFHVPTLSGYIPAHIRFADQVVYKGPSTGPSLSA